MAEKQAKNLVLNVGEESFVLAASGYNILEELGITEERLVELLSRDSYCPTLSSAPSSSTITYVDTDGSVNHFSQGQLCRWIADGDVRMAICKDVSATEASWYVIPTKLSELENDADFYSGANVQAVDTDDVLDDTGVTYLTAAPQVLSDNEKATVQSNLGIEEKFATKEELQDKSVAYRLVEHGTSDTTFTLTPNEFHVWDIVETLDLDFGEEVPGYANEYTFQFTSGDTATMLLLPDSVKWANGMAPVISEGMIYQVSVLRGLASVLAFNLN